jgi:catechol 2,3-dioxygenase-like lactoylglutathione lyase family enzyme
MASSCVSFGRALLMVRGTNGVAAAVNFYQNGLGMALVRHTDDWAELTCQGIIYESFIFYVTVMQF